MVATKFISDLKMTKKGQINYWFVLVTPHNAKKNNQNTFVNQMPSCVQCVPKKSHLQMFGDQYQEQKYKLNN